MCVKIYLGVKRTFPKTRWGVLKLDQRLRSNAKRETLKMDLRLSVFVVMIFLSGFCLFALSDKSAKLNGLF